MFIPNKYTKIYFSLMEKAKLRDRISLFEYHHIIPKSLGGSNLSDNIIKLSPREHFIAHALLTKMVSEKKHKRAISYAFVRMKMTNNNNGYSRIGNGKLYEVIKKQIRETYSGENNPFYGNTSLSGINNPFYGKTHSEETKKEISKKLKGKMVGEKNPFYGKTHSKELVERFSQKRSESVTIIFIDGTKETFRRKKDIGKYLGIGESTGVQLCSIKRHLWDKYNIKEILDENNINKESSNTTSL